MSGESKMTTASKHHCYSCERELTEQEYKDGLMSQDPYSRVKQTDAECDECAEARWDNHYDGDRWYWG